MTSGVYIRQIRPIQDRFWEKVNIAGDDECWEWQACRTKIGYGQFGIRNRIWKAHRIAWLLTHKQNPRDKFICHHCDNPSCCNPKHLFLGNNQLNMQDKAQKGKSNGELNNYSKLVTQEVLDIRMLYSTGEYSQQRLGDMYNVSRTCIKKIVQRKTWRHI